MKSQLIQTIAIASIGTMVAFSSCKKDAYEEEAPEIRFKTDVGYTYTNTTAKIGDTLVVGIIARVREERDPLKKFTISRSVNDGAVEDLYSEDLSSDSFEYDYQIAIDSTQSGNSVKYLFTVINRDGLTGQVSLSIDIN